jgi:hypothetical protein
MRHPHIYRDALQVQNASNLTGVARSLNELLQGSWLREDMKARGVEAHTQNINTHPAVVLFVDKMADLAGVLRHLLDVSYVQSFDICTQRANEGKFMAGDRFWWVDSDDDQCSGWVVLAAPEGDGRWIAKHSEDSSSVVQVLEHELHEDPVVPAGYVPWIKRCGDIHFACSNSNHTMCQLPMLGNNYKDESRGREMCPKCWEAFLSSVRC